MTTHHVPIPRGVPPQAVRIRPVEFQIRTMIDYDPVYLRDRLVSEVFTDGRSTGIYSALGVPDSVLNTGDVQRTMQNYGPINERNLIDEFLGLGYRRQVRDLQAKVDELEAYIRRPRWFHFNRIRRVFNRSK